VSPLTDFGSLPLNRSLAVAQSPWCYRSQCGLVSLYLLLCSCSGCAPFVAVQVMLRFALPWLRIT
jgi:hypothetical protein